MGVVPSAVLIHPIVDSGGDGSGAKAEFSKMRGFAVMAMVSIIPDSIEGFRAHNPSKCGASEVAFMVTIWITFFLAMVPDDLFGANTGNDPFSDMAAVVVAMSTLRRFLVNVYQVVIAGPVTG